MASFISKLVERAGKPPKPRNVVLPDEDADHQPEIGQDGRDWADGQAFMIEYVDAVGNASTRRIAVWSTWMGDRTVYLGAFCYERNAYRTFRTDRIQSVIDFDGVVYDDVPAALDEILGISPEWQNSDRNAPAEKPELTNWERLRDVIRPHGWLLSALGRSDGKMEKKELDVAVEHTQSVGRSHLGEDIDIDTNKLRTYLRQISPTEYTLSKGLKDLAKRPPGEIADFLKASKAIILADGVVDEEEIALVNEIVDVLMDAHGLSSE